MSTNGTSCNSAARGRLLRPFLRASAPCPLTPSRAVAQDQSSGPEGALYFWRYACACRSEAHCVKLNGAGDVKKSNATALRGTNGTRQSQAPEGKAGHCAGVAAART